MGNWLDEAIQNAMNNGEFDNLPGMGKPLPPERTSFEDPTMKLAYKIMKEHEVVPAWIAERREIVEKLEQARQTLKAAWQWHEQSRITDAHAATRYWQRAEGNFRSEAQRLNKRIFDFNLSLTITSQHLFQVDIDAELKRAQS